VSGETIVFETWYWYWYWCVMVLVWCVMVCYGVVWYNIVDFGSR